MKRLLVLAILVVLVAPGNRLQDAFADTDPIQQALTGMEIRQARIPTSGVTSFDHSTGSAYSPSFSSFRDPNLFCTTSGDGKCDVPDELDFKAQTPGRDSKMNYYGSMIGFAAGMNSKSHSDATVNTYLPGDLSLTYITLGLTEPSVANGLAQAVAYIGNDVNNRLQSEQTFFSQVAVMPEVGQQLGQAHVACIAAKQAAGENWMSAQAACTGDTGDKTVLTGNKLKFDDTSKGIAQVNFQNDPNWWDEGLPSTDKEYYIRLSDYLFAQDTAESGTKSKTTPYGKLRGDFLLYAGDITYKMEKQTDVKTQGQVSLKFTKSNPTYTFEQLYENDSKQYYENILTLLRQYCLWTLIPGNGPTGSAADMLDMNGSQSGANLSQWWWFTSSASGGGGGTFSRYASVPGFNFTPMNMDSLLGLYIYTFPPKLPLDASYCDSNLDPTSGPFKWDTVTQAGNIVQQGPIIRAVFFMAQRLGMAYALQTHMILQNFVKKISIGPFDTVAKAAALRLLDEAAYHQDLQSMYDDNVADLRKYADDLSKYQHQVVGVKSRMIEQLPAQGTGAKQGAMNAG